MVAKIAVSAAVFSMDKPYSYRIPPEMTVLPGQRVMVPFGKGNRRTEGIVLAVENADASGLKPVDKVLDPEPVLEEVMLQLAAFVRQRCFCTFYDAVRAMLPAGLWFQVKDTYRIKAESEVCREAAKRNPQAVEVAEVIASEPDGISYAALKKKFSDETMLQECLRYLLRKDLISSETDYLQKVGDKTECIVTLSASGEEAEEYAARKQKSAPIQAEVLRLMCSVGSACAKEVMYFTGASMVTLRRLQKLGFLEFSNREVLRRVEAQEVKPAAPLVLSEEQKTAYNGILEQMKGEKKTALLYGVTGSGKTSVYISLIQACLEQGKSAILLVPEIALTPQLMGLMVSHFGDLAAVLHSGLRVGQRYDEWKRIRSGKARVVVGTRSAVFAPACNLGLLILDEEQEHTYKSENSPRYHAREIALWRGAKQGAQVVLGSATPSVESMYHGKNGDYALFTLSQRYNGRLLPDVEIADMRQELKSGNGGAVSGKLLGRLQDCVQEGRQSILFLNRRGSSRFMVCVECGDVPQCPRCSVSLTYHSANRRLMCHYCGHSQPMTESCESCGGALKPMGAGTQKVEQELLEKLPGAQVLRMDADTVTAVNNHGAILKKFKEENIPILLGTQMVAKGLDFENVTLVGVLDADLSLYVDNFRAAETTFSMITQVVGRAGRGSREGRALIQTMTPEHNVIRLAAKQDYDAFFEQEIEVRRARRFPPFSDLITVGVSGIDEGQVLQAAGLLRNWLEVFLQKAEYRNYRVDLLGPAPAAVAKINNRYHYRLTICSDKCKEIRQLLAHLLRELMKQKNMRGIGVFADSNPYE